MKKKTIMMLAAAGLLYAGETSAQNKAQNTYPIPTERQLNWAENEFYLFVHFGPNTFTGVEWGNGTEKPGVFNPSALDCRQWARTAKESGATGIIMTAKHHDGFSLWPSKYSTHTVRESAWRDGKGDVMRELAAACKEYGLKLGVYLSPWDQNHPQYGTPEYNDVFVNTMKELVQEYGPFFEFWWDGANGEGLNGKRQVYDWPRFEKTLRDIAPNTPVFSDLGPDIRWVGNERGFAGKTNWNLLDTVGFSRGLGAPHVDTLNQGNFQGQAWIPAECDVSIRPGWFYRATEDDKVKSPEVLFDLWLKSVGRGSTLLLNVPPNQEGIFAPQDVASLMAFKKLRDANLKTPLAKQTFPPAKKVMPSYTVKLKKAEPMNTVMIEEDLSYGQKVAAFTVQVKKGGKVLQNVEGTTIGRKRILTFPSVIADEVVLVIKGAKAAPVLSTMSIYKMEDRLIEQDWNESAIDNERIHRE